PELSIQGVSFVTPVRKKLTILTFRDRIVALPTPDTSIGDAIVNMSFNDDIEMIANLTCAPPPAKPSIVVLPTSDDHARPNAMVFISPVNQADTDALLDVFNRAGVRRFDDSSIFAVPAYRGTQDGFLFFSSTGIIFGFKKPIWFVSRLQLEEIAYSDITRLTFNLTISTSASPKPVEFSLIDQKYYPQIDNYVRQWRVADASLAAERAAAPPSANSVPTGDLERARREFEGMDSDDEDDSTFSNGDGVNGDNEDGASGDDTDDDSDDDNFEPPELDDGGSPSPNEDSDAG
ncbi:histone chaperone Rttp106-like-domain-containing protein, partial [Dipodascopsis uninucleata]